MCQKIPMKKIVLVTGAAKGIGKAIVMRMIRENYFVLAVDTDKEEGRKLENSTGKDELEFLSCNICKEPEVLRLFGQINEKYHQLDILVNNAGVIRDNM